MKREGVNERGRGDEGVGHPQARQLTSQETCSLRNAPINEHLVHPSQQSSDSGLVIVVGTREQLGPGDHRVREPARSRREPLESIEMINTDVGVYE